MVTAKQRAKTTGTRKPATGVAIPKGIVEQATLTLHDLPEKPKESLSLKETIESMYDAIKAALAKGYSQEDVASFLSEKGVDISPASLKYYLSRLGRAKATESAKPRKVRRTKSQTADVDSANGSTDQATAAPKRRGGRAATQTTEGKTTKRAAAKSKSTAAETPVADSPAETKAPASKRGSRSTSQTKTKAPAKSRASAANSPAPKPTTRQRKKA